MQTHPLTLIEQSNAASRMSKVLIYNKDAIKQAIARHVRKVGFSLTPSDSRLIDDIRAHINLCTDRLNESALDYRDAIFGFAILAERCQYAKLWILRDLLEGRN